MSDLEEKTKSAFDDEINFLLNLRTQVRVLDKDQTVIEKNIHIGEFASKVNESAKDGFMKVLYNEQVMIALIEQEYIRDKLTEKVSDGKYTRFLQVLLCSNNRAKVQEACCR